ncbi:ATP-grasp domain-containing protein [Geomonas propionica]|uniref:ATP-grasp domain-containing protein n=1 Tax=Geomonas propionica TaxID=2798582 RepID=A0ABS0YUQ7_9BACT|nr:ATP-grasp domain-containing protein [Geomonas propionica]MBJ6801706.1 ATP-grasp domain-containing protein [Geomonas propionica]
MNYNNKKKSLLFTGGGGAGSEALSRLLGDRFDVHFADADLNAKPHGIASCNFHKIPFANAPEFIHELGRLCQDLGVELLVPGVDEELLPVARQRESFGCEVLLPPADFISIHLDKFTSNRLLVEQGLPAPLTEPMLERKAIDFPCIAKPCHGRGSRDVAVVRSEEEMRAHVLLSRRPAADFIVQELLQGQEFTVMMAADRSGLLRAVVPVKVDIKRGITLRAETAADSAVIDACCAIHAANPVPGCYNIQLIKMEDGNCKPFEINPRISTTGCLALAAGASFVDLYLGNDTNEGLVPFAAGMRLRRSWYNEFLA